jgi:hypothetical protein
VAINLFVESDGSQPVQPAYLRGGEQARRHRVACNRGHGLLRCYVEYWYPGTPYRSKSIPQIIIAACKAWRKFCSLAARSPPPRNHATRVATMPGKINVSYVVFLAATAARQLFHSF